MWTERTRCHVRRYHGTEKARDRDRRYRERNRATIRERGRQRYWGPLHDQLRAAARVREHAWRTNHPGLAAERSRAWYAAHKDRAYTRKLRKVYGIQREDLDRLYARQGGKCAVCLRDAPRTDLCVDHDHASGRVRGLLHKTCNSAIGLLGDSAEIATNAARYLSARGAV